MKPKTRLWWVVEVTNFKSHFGENNSSWRENCFHYFLRFLLLSSLSLSSELDESDCDSEPDDSESEESELPDWESDTGFCCCMIRRGIFFRYSRRFSVRPPSPIDVKKLMQNRVFLGLSFGNMDSNESCIVGSFNRSFSSLMPRCSDNSCNRCNVKVKSTANASIRYYHTQDRTTSRDTFNLKRVYLTRYIAIIELAHRTDKSTRLRILAMVTCPNEVQDKTETHNLTRNHNIFG